jgi:hypothetical protein
MLLPFFEVLDSRGEDAPGRETKSEFTQKHDLALFDTFFVFFIKHFVHNTHGFFVVNMIQMTDDKA